MSLNSLTEIDLYYRPLLLFPNSLQDSKKIMELKENSSTIVLDTLDAQVGELIKITHPSQKFSQEEIKRKTGDFFNEMDRKTYGVWVYYSWRNTLVRILEERHFVQLRTSRNRYKITQEEQDLLCTKKVGIIGLSVGQSVALSLAMERTFGELRIADFDTLDLSNMNRIRTGLYHLGIKKAWIVAREIAEIDPFLKIVLYDEGISEENMDDFFTLGGKLDLLIEECDSLQVKLASRLKAKSLGIPVLMDTSDRGMMDVERFDLEPKRPIFHGLLEEFGEEDQILHILGRKHGEIMMSILDFENLSGRARESIAQIGKTITTWPQTASSVIMGGAVCAFFSRKLLLDEGPVSGRLYVDLDELIKSHEG